MSCIADMTDLKLMTLNRVSFMPGFVRNIKDESSHMSLTVINIGQYQRVMYQVPSNCNEHRQILGYYK